MIAPLPESKAPRFPLHFRVRAENCAARKKRLSALGGVLLGVLLTACEPSAEVRPDISPRELRAEWFLDATAEVGLEFRHDPGAVGSYFFPQIMGSGVALFDSDGDGLLDIYLLHNAGPNSTSAN